MTFGRQDFCDGISRRGLIKAGLGGFIGLSMADLLRLQADSAAHNSRPDTAVIFLELAGGPTQHETYDPKPNAPQEYRGPLRAIQTNVPGIQLSEFMAEQARVMDKIAVIRSIHHDSGSHGTSSHLTQTGYYLQDRQNRANEKPCIGSVTARVRGANASGMPAFVSIPTAMRYGNASYFGQGYNPYQTGSYSSSVANFRARNLSLIGGMSMDRLDNRRSLLASFDEGRRIVDNENLGEAMDQFNQQAFEMVTGDRAREAFDLSSEDERTRQRYGMERRGMGQGALLARRLVERGVTFVTVRMNTNGSWDDHNGIANRMRAKGPHYDLAVAALVEDLHQRGLARKVMVVAMGEFGRTPRVNRNAGRDHWGRVMSVMVAGGGLRTGQAIGASDSKGATPADQPYRPENVLAMVYRHLGIDPATTFPDPTGRPRYLLEERELIRELI
ncbi:MAG: DUF1501 domain-containing protein [Gemmataceae bacterium]